MATNPHISEAGYTGRYSTYWDYTNRDAGGLYPHNCCGQAAVFSALKTMGMIEGSLKSFVQKYHPDVFGGSLGSSKELIKKMVRENGRYIHNTYEESGLRNSLRSGPVIICLDVNAAGGDKWGLHWVCVFGYSASRYYLSNWYEDAIQRNKFIAGWNTILTTIASTTSNTGYAIPN
jgi:hypothetical protein